jgi:hypothetical protein
LACLRSTCPNPACDFVRTFASSDPDCQDFTGSFDFENTVFSQFATTPNPAQLQTTLSMSENICSGRSLLISQIDGITAVTNAIEIGLTTAAADELASSVLEPWMAPGAVGVSLGVLYTQHYGPLDSQSIATSLAGGLHFYNDVCLLN